MARLRRFLRTQSWIGLVAFLCGWMPVVEAHSLSGSDPCFDSGVAGSGASTATIAATPSGHKEPAHCLICHLMRAMNGDVRAETMPPVPCAGVARQPLRTDAALTVTYSATPPRGPPATL